MMRRIDGEITVVLLANIALDDGAVRTTMHDAFAWALEFASP